MTAKNKLVVPKGIQADIPSLENHKNGNRMYARDHGLRGWPLLVPVSK